MKDTELKQMRDRDLYGTYERCIRERSFTSEGEAADYARLQPAPQYYISARTASLLIGQIERRISLIQLNVNSRHRIWALYDRYMQYLANNPGNTLSRELVLELLVEEPAPEFYLSPGRAKHIITYERRSARKRMMERKRP